MGAARATAVLGACILAAYPSLLAEPGPFLVLAGFAGAALVVVAAATGRGWPAWAGASLLGLGYVVALVLRDGQVDPFAPAVAAGLYLVVEATEIASSGGAHTGGRVWHALTIAFAGALLVGALLIAGTAVRSSGPLAAAASALCGALLLFGLVPFAGARAGGDG